MNINLIQPTVAAVTRSILIDFNLEILSELSSINVITLDDLLQGSPGEMRHARRVRDISCAFLEQGVHIASGKSV